MLNFIASTNNDERNYWTQWLTFVNNVVSNVKASNEQIMLVQTSKIPLNDIKVSSQYWYLGIGKWKFEHLW